MVIEYTHIKQILEQRQLHWDKGGHYTIIEVSIYQEEITFLRAHAFSKRAEKFCFKIYGNENIELWRCINPSNYTPEFNTIDQ